MSSLRYSVLDLALVKENRSIKDTFAASLETAQYAEKLGFTRYWFAEHHNMENVASSATSILIGHIAQNTHTIRVGSGGVMLPNHTPLIVAEQFGTLATLFPDRIDLGLGRAPGTDPLTAYEIRGERMHAVQDFPHDVLKLMNFLGERSPDQKVRAIPGAATFVPIWILGSSTESARLAAAFGLPYAFAAHFAPTAFFDAIALYRQQFRPSAYCQQPYVLACINLIAADTDDHAYFLASSMKRMFKAIVNKESRPLPAPATFDLSECTPEEQFALENMLSLSIIGGRDRVKSQLIDFYKKSKIDELMLNTPVYDEIERLNTLKIAAEIIKES